MSGELISRQAIFEQIYCWLGSGEYRYTNATDYLMERIRDIPSVTPQEPKTGHWIKAKPWMLDNTSYKWECSECEKSERFRHNYCPNCGARMQESDDEWDRVTMIDVNGNTHKVTFKKEIEG